ncbi:MAG: AAA family ATPase [Gammaproteobacteria bacterium]|nr:AAA family ATPase [Gammaproteobacteria bacterium]
MKKKSKTYIDQVTLTDFRCFSGKHSARLAPLTVLVGENSTGKTSFLALISALWGLVHNGDVPDFKEAPYDLGSFPEIAHHEGGSAKKTQQFEADLRICDSRASAASFSFAFEKKGAVPYPTVRRFSNKTGLLSVSELNGKLQLSAETDKGHAWDTTIHVEFPQANTPHLLPLGFVWFLCNKNRDQDEEPPKVVKRLIADLGRFERHPGSRLFASAPVRSKPHRTYDPARHSQDPEGDYVPMYMAYLAHQHPRQWAAFEEKLVGFGKTSGLFDEIRIKSLGKREGQPFQIEVRKQGNTKHGPWRNLVDVGYGVSQILPLITELMRHDAPALTLLQQPEVHLHPSAQAALGSIFGHLATDRQIVVETHSDFLINRIRMDIRDQKVPLSPSDVSILYFERGEIDVHIHSIGIDQQGNITGAPPGYGRFFMEEAARSEQY